MKLFSLQLSAKFLGKRILSRNIHVPAVVECEWVQKHEKDVKFLDAAFSMKPKQNHDLFLCSNYGQFEKLIKEKINADYLTGHIPRAVHFNLDIASYPGKYARFGLYPPKIFEKYMQLLGLHNSDTLVVYGRGPAAGMLFAARVWWTLKAYGHQKVSVLNGGFDAWLKSGGKVSADAVIPPKGTWMATQAFDDSRMVSFDELISQENGTPLLDKLESVNFLDTRVADQFNGKIPLEYPAKHATGSHIKGSKNVPVASVTDAKGLKSKNEILQVLRSVGFDVTRPSYLTCNRAIQASLVSLALEHADLEGKVYNGSYEELSQRASRYINSK